MQIFVKSSAGSVPIQCLPSDKVEDVKCLISKRTGLKEPELAYNGRVLEDVCTLYDYLVSEEATLEAYVPVLGGELLRLHGSVGNRFRSCCKNDITFPSPNVEKPDLVAVWF